MQTLADCCKSRGCKFCLLSLYSKPRGCKIDLRSLFSNAGGHKWIKMVKKHSWRAAKPIFFHLTIYNPVKNQNGTDTQLNISYS